MSDRRLQVWLYDQPAGWLLLKANGNLQFRYHAAYVERQGPPLGQAMPLADHAYPHRTCLAVFGGMLPEQGPRLATALQLGVSAENDFRLLAELGGDAVTLPARCRCSPKTMSQPVSAA